MRIISILTLVMAFYSCTKQSTNARLYTPAASKVDSPVIDSNKNLCRHSDANNYLLQCSDESGECYFYACKDERYVEYSKYEEYLSYVERYGGGVYSDPSLCKTLKEDGKGCAHPEALNYAGAAVKEKGPCEFEACIDPEYQEYYSKYLFYKKYVADFGGKVYPSEDMCKVPVGGCKFDSKYVLNYDANAKVENGSCKFQGCSDSAYYEFNPELESDIQSYKDELEDQKLVYTGEVINTCEKIKGCTSQTAENYNAQAQVDDGSCIIKCCSTQGYSNYQMSCQKNIDDYKNLLTQNNTDQIGILDNANSCGDKLGCTVSEAYNYDQDASKDNGTCKFRACLTQGTENYENDRDIVDAFNDYGIGTIESGECGAVLGCMDSKAKNFDSKAMVENGSCEFHACTTQGTKNYLPHTPIRDAYTAYKSQYSSAKLIAIDCGGKLGCTSPKAYNYDSTAQVEDGVSCKFRACLVSGTANYDGDAPIRLAHEMYNFGQIEAGECGGKLGCKQPLANNYNSSAAVDNGSCKFTACNTPGTANYETDKAIVSAFNAYGNGTLTLRDCGGVLGCTNNKAINYMMLAQVDDKSCKFKACLTPGTEMYESDASIRAAHSAYGYGDIIAGNCGLKLGCTNQHAVNYDPIATLDKDKTCVFKACNTPNTENYASHQAIRDAFTLYGSGTLQPDNCGQTIGCKDPLAYNYNSSVQVEDGVSCKFRACATPGTVNYDTDKNIRDAFDNYKYGTLEPRDCGGKLGCTIDLAYNTTVGATVDDGTCKFKTCLTEGTENYASGAAIRAAHSAYGQGVIEADNCGGKIGCTQPLAENYDSTAQVDPSYQCIFKACQTMGTANYESDKPKREAFDAYGHGVLQPGECGGKLGCMISLAKNYDATALVDDKSCEFEACNTPGTENYDSDSAVRDAFASYGFGNLLPKDCGLKLGCMQPLADNYDSTAGKDDYLCQFSACNTPGTEKYEGHANIRQAYMDYGYGALNELDCGGLIGCTEDLAYNTTPNATVENGTCKFKACTTPGTVNYDKDSDIREAFSKYNTGVLEEGDCGNVYGCSFQGAKNYTASNEENGSCIFVGCSDPKFSNYDPNLSSTVMTYKEFLKSLNPEIDYNGSIEVNCEGLLGCTETLAKNYNSNAQVDDKSCIFEGCDDPNAVNTDNDIITAATNYGVGINRVGCEYSPYYSCLCEDSGSAKTIDENDEKKVLLITDPEVLSALEDGVQGGSPVNFGRLLGGLSVNGSNTDAIIQSYIDSYRFEQLENVEAQAATNTADVIENNWRRSMLASGFDIDGSPYKLIGVVFRPDLVKYDGSKLLTAGQGRFIYKLKDGLKKTVLTPCTETVTNTETVPGNCSSRYGCPTSTTVITTEVETMCETEVDITKPNHVIFEYDLPVNGEYSKNDWHYHWSKLKCLSGQEYKSQLYKIIQAFAFTKYDYKDCTTPESQMAYGHTTVAQECGKNRVPLSQVRVNSFVESHFITNAPWILFEAKPIGLGNSLERVSMPHTAIDTGATSDQIRGWDQEFSQDKKDVLAADFISQFDKISDPFSEYTVENNAIQNSYRIGASWATELMSHPSLNSLDPVDKSFALYRYSLNSCNGCHSGAFTNHDPDSDNSLGLNSQAFLNKFGPQRFSSITQPNDFLHLHSDGSVSDFLAEDLGYRAYDLEVSLSENYCRSPGSYTELDPVMTVTQFACKVDQNEDGKLTQVDITILQNKLDMMSSQNCMKLPDVNGDGVITSADVGKLSQLIGANNLVDSLGTSQSCKDINQGTCANSLPTCDADEVLEEKEPGKFICKDEVIQCQVNQVIQIDQIAGPKCVTQTPTCIEGSELQNVNGNLTCVSVTQNSNCSQGEMLINGICHPIQCPVGTEFNGTTCVTDTSVTTTTTTVATNSNTCLTGFTEDPRKKGRNPKVCIPNCPEGQLSSHANLPGYCHPQCPEGTIFRRNNFTLQCLSICSEGLQFNNGTCN